MVQEPCLAPHPALRADLSPRKSGERLKKARAWRVCVRWRRLQPAGNPAARPAYDDERVCIIAAAALGSLS
jgi:hypothetical protein